MIGLVRADLHSELVLWRDGGALSSVTQQLLYEIGDIPTGDGDVLDRRADNIALSLERQRHMFPNLRAVDIRQEWCLCRRSVSNCGVGAARKDVRVTPSPESMTTPVKVRSLTFDDVHDAASAKTACTAMYLRPIQ